MLDLRSRRIGGRAAIWKHRRYPIMSPITGGTFVPAIGCTLVRWTKWIRIYILISFKPASEAIDAALFPNDGSRYRGTAIRSVRWHGADVFPRRGCWQKAGAGRFHLQPLSVRAAHGRRPRRLRAR